MLRNYAITALRNLIRNKFYAAINIVGLAVGFTAAILIALYVRDELSYDSWVPGHEHIYRADITFTRSGAPYRHFATSGVSLAADLRAAYPQVEQAVRYSSDRNALRHGDFEGIERVAWADPDFFKMFPLAVVAGSLDAALSAPDHIVLTRRIARKYFGTDAPIGQVVDLDRDHPMQVAAVVENLPSNTNIDGDVFAPSSAPFSTIALADALPPEKERGHQFLLTFVRLAPGARTADFDDFFQHQPDDGGPGPLQPGLRLVPLGEVHLTAIDSGAPGEKAAGSHAANSAIVTVAVLILFAAGINFINLMTARMTRRAAEVGVRKTTGAFRRDLMLQFLGESFIYVAIAFVLAIAAAGALLPSVNAFLERSIALQWWFGPWPVAAVLSILILLSLATGAYPAFVLSCFRPAAVLKSGVIQSPGSNRVRQTLVVLQFAVLIGLTLSTALVYQQDLYAVRNRLRLEGDQVLVVSGTEACDRAFVDRVKTISGVDAAACSWVMPLMDGSSTTAAYLQDGSRVPLRYDVAGPGFFEMYGVAPLAGRLFDLARPGDSVSPNQTDPQVIPPVVINETASKVLGFASPEQAIGHSFTWSRVIDFKTWSSTDRLPSEIIGVVPDFALDSIRRKIDPAFFYADTGLFQRLNVKLKGGQIPETIGTIDRLWKEGHHTRPIVRTFLDQYMGILYRDVGRQSQLFTAFAGVALFIAALGLLGLSSFIAEARTKEIGIRKAMGASRADVLRLLLWQFAKPVLWANLIAWPVAGYLMNRWLHGFAYHVDLNPLIFLAASAAALAIALATVAGHALLVARAKPVAALRYE